MDHIKELREFDALKGGDEDSLKKYWNFVVKKLHD